MSPFWSGTSSMENEKNWSQLHLARQTRCSPLHRWYLQNKWSLFYWKASVHFFVQRGFFFCWPPTKGPKLALGLLIGLWLIGNNDSKCVWELQVCLLGTRGVIPWSGCNCPFPLVCCWAEVLFPLGFCSDRQALPMACWSDYYTALWNLTGMWFDQLWCPVSSVTAWLRWAMWHLQGGPCLLL